MLPTNSLPSTPCLSDPLQARALNTIGYLAFILEYKASPPSYPAPIRAFYFPELFGPPGQGADTYFSSAAPGQKVSGASIIEDLIWGTLRFYCGKTINGLNYEEQWSGRRGSTSQLSAWESKFSILYFQYLQNRAEKGYVHALHILHAVPDLRVAGGRLGDGFIDIRGGFHGRQYGRQYSRSVQPARSLQIAGCLLFATIVKKPSRSSNRLPLKSRDHFNCSYSFFACTRIGISLSAFFHNAKKSW